MYFKIGDNMTINIKNFKEAYKLGNKIKEEMKTTKEIGTGLLGEQMIIASYKTMTIDNLEKLRIVLNHVIEEKKRFKTLQHLNLSNDNKPLNVYNMD